jgi:hypothetical protein
MDIRIFSQELKRKRWKQIRKEHYRKIKRGRKKYKGRIIKIIFICVEKSVDRLCGLVEFLATDPEVPESIPGTTKFSEK